MTRKGNPRQLFADLVADCVGYRKLEQLLDDQFAAALRIDTLALGTLAQSIAGEVDTLDLHRRYRVEQLGNVPGAVQALGAKVFAGERHAEQRKAVAERCAEMNTLAARCQARASRNGALLAGQYEAMQRVLHGERHTYVPA